MTQPNVEATLTVRYLETGPVVETRARAIAAGSPIPRGKLLVLRVPILPPGTSEARTRTGIETLIVDDDGTPFGGLCWTDRLETEKPIHLIGFEAGASVAGSLEHPRRDRIHATFI
jgi:hypothetical protein